MLHYRINVNKEPFAESEWTHQRTYEADPQPSLTFHDTLNTPCHTLSAIDATVEEAEVAEALSQVLDRRNHPMLIHCNKGKVSRSCPWQCQAETGD